MDCFADGVFRDDVVVFVVGDDCGEYVGGCCVDIADVLQKYKPDSITV